MPLPLGVPLSRHSHSLGKGCFANSHSLHFSTDHPLRFYRNNTPLEEHVDQSALTKRYTEEALKFIREDANEPF